MIIIRMAAAAALTVCAVATHAENKVGQAPSVGAEATATVGSPVLEKFRYDAVKVFVTQTDVVRGTITGNNRIAAADPLQQVSSRAKYKACSFRGPCALDDDGDGKFDRIALDDVVAALKLKAPVPYEIRDAVAPSSTGNFKQVVTFLGVNGDMLRLSYREFLNDMARPAFTEELTFPQGRIFPQPIAFKDTRITVLGIDGAGMRYRVDK